MTVMTKTAWTECCICHEKFLRVAPDDTLSPNACIACQDTFTANVRDVLMPIMERQKVPATITKYSQVGKP